MGGCVSRPKELDDTKPIPAEKPAEVEVSTKPVEVEDHAPAQEVKAETTTKPEIKEELLVDLSESKPEAEKTEVMALAPEISEQVDAPKVEETAPVKEDTPIAEQVTVIEKKEKMAETKAEEAKNEDVVADKESEDKVSS
ncbi:uncharacterized protein A4U43_C10F1770 [Asparagus officinalis]|uniref:Uncharacterized protein n=1 Tax=Asparagus officinalis TaxID=4686 RepID=A0A5P1E4A6_ASPOF|nr:chondroitin proteoglycan 1 [Asparagus officinalis]ONK55866.1 uncharacterized protein A4U43_C10F1770 [Asparagus officinalis]